MCKLPGTWESMSRKRCGLTSSAGISRLQCHRAEPFPVLLLPMWPPFWLKPRQIRQRSALPMFFSRTSCHATVPVTNSPSSCLSIREHCHCVNEAGGFLFDTVKDDAEAGDVPLPSSLASTLCRFTVVPLLQSDQAGRAKAGCHHAIPAQTDCLV